MDYNALMKHVFELAKKGRGYVSPNPLVGAVIVRDGEIISEGYHRKFGGPHAEVEAIRNSSLDSFETCTIVVNLEPCSHFGKTPPCADLIIDKAFAKVVIAARDPNPIVSGNGINKIKDAEIEVIEGILEDEAKWLNRSFIKHISKNEPYIIAKAAQSFDGNIALNNGISKWISGEESRKRTHRLRSFLDGILVGKDTVLSDDPSLTVRDVEGRHPKRIIFDSKLSLDISKKIFTNLDLAQTIVCCTENFDNSKKKVLEDKGIITIICNSNPEGKIDINDALAKLSPYTASILLEGGSGLMSSFLKEQKIDEFQFFIAPKIIGNGIGSFSKFTIDSMDKAIQLIFKEVNKSGEDIQIIALPKYR